MITLIEALNYRCLRYASRPLGAFHVLVGPNASGKTTFLDVLGFLQDLVTTGITEAIENRTGNPEELLFQHQGKNLELAIEARIPDDLRKRTAKPHLDTARYEVAIGFDETMRQFEIKAETLLLRTADEKTERRRPSFPMPSSAPTSLSVNKRLKSNKVVVSKVSGGNNNFYNETYKTGKGRTASFNLSPLHSALGNLPSDDRNFPVAMWFRDHLANGVQRLVLNSLEIRKPSPPSRAKGFRPDGSSLPWLVSRLRQKNKRRYRSWIAHLQIVLPDLVDITTVERPDDRHRYLVYNTSMPADTKYRPGSSPTAPYGIRRSFCWHMSTPTIYSRGSFWSRSPRTGSTLVPCRRSMTRSRRCIRGRC